MPRLCHLTTSKRLFLPLPRFLRIIPYYNYFWNYQKKKRKKEKKGAHTTTSINTPFHLCLESSFITIISKITKRKKEEKKEKKSLF